MSHQSGQIAELEDLFESSVNLEEHHFQQGHNEGLKQGLLLGKAEGRDVGLKSGFETGEELGFYKGCIYIWNAAIEIEPNVFSTRVRKNLKQLEELVEKYPLLEPENETVQDILEALRTKFRTISAMLSVHLEYEGYPKSSQAKATMEMLGIQSVRFSLPLGKCLPLRSGLGSRVGSAAAAAV